MLEIREHDNPVVRPLDDAMTPSIAVDIESAGLEETYEPWDEVKGPDVVEPSAVRPAYEEGQHAPNRSIRDDDRIACWGRGQLRQRAVAFYVCNAKSGGLRS